MTAKHNSMITQFLLTFLLFQTACVSYKHQPDRVTLADSPDCNIVNGSYVVESARDGRVLADYLFDEDEVVSAITIEKYEFKIAVRAKTDKGQSLPTTFLVRWTCDDSILRVILSDQGAGNAIGMEASDQALELFVSGEDALNLRFINTTLGFFYIIPYYSSGDELVTLQRRQSDPN